MPESVTALHLPLVHSYWWRQVALAFPCLRISLAVSYHELIIKRLKDSPRHSTFDRKGRVVAHNDRTSMGGQNRSFATTHWTEILSARTLDQARRREAMVVVLARYWKPMYCYLRRKGHNNEEAKDLVQSFCQEIALGRGLIQQADPERGRFRTFLLMSLSRYASNVRRAEATRKRAPAGVMFALDDVAAMDMPELSHEMTPAEAFNYAWASQLLDDVLAAIEAGCRDNGKDVHWEVFHERTVTPLMERMFQAVFFAIVFTADS